MDSMDRNAVAMALQSGGNAFVLDDLYQMVRDGDTGRWAFERLDTGNAASPVPGPATAAAQATHR